MPRIQSGRELGLPGFLARKNASAASTNLGASSEEDWPLVAIRNHPHRGVRNCAVHLDRHLDRIEKVTVAADDERRRGDCR